VIPSAQTRPAKFSSKTSALVLIAIFAFSVSGCGRAGRLEPPPDPNAVAKPDDPAHPQVHHKPPPIVPPKDPFFLDPIL
jgi:predicted small lipoprotein YifL